MIKDYIISEKYNKKNITFVYSGTIAIETVLQNENIKKGDIVLVPNNVCYRVLTAILRTGATPLIIRPENELIITSSDIYKAMEKYKIKVILAVHQFGLNVNIREIRKVCKNKEIIIEDIAQGWDVNSNSKLGKDSDYIISSMGKDKPLDFGVGGIIITNKDVKKILDYNNIESRYSNGKLLPYVLPSNLNINIKDLVKIANSKKKNNEKYATICIEKIKNNKIEFYKTDKIENCYWERFPIWTENIEIYNKMVEIAEKTKIAYEPSHEKLLEELPLLNNFNFKYLNLSKKKRYFIFLKTGQFEKEKLLEFIKEINKI